MKRLLAIGRLSHDSQSILTAVHRAAPMDLKLCFNIFHANNLVRPKLCVAVFAHADDGGWGFSYDPQFALRHDTSLAPNVCANETAPVPTKYNLRHIRCALYRIEPACQSRTPNPIHPRAQACPPHCWRTALARSPLGLA